MQVEGDIIKHEILRIVGNCATDPVLKILAFARANRIDLAVPNCLGWLLFEFMEAKIISIFE